MAVDFIRLNDPVRDLGQLNRFIQQVVDELNQQHVTRPGAKALATGGNVTNIGGRGRGGHIIQDERVTLPNRTFLNFTGCGVTATDDLLLDTTDVTIPFGGVNKVFRDYTIVPEDEGKLIVADIGGVYTATFGGSFLSGSTATNATGSIDGDPNSYAELTRIDYSLSDDGWLETKFVANVPFDATDGNVTVTASVETFKVGPTVAQSRAVALMPTSDVRHTDYPYNSLLLGVNPLTQYSPKQTFSVALTPLDMTLGGFSDTIILHAEHIAGFLSFDTTNYLRIYDFSVTTTTRTNKVSLPAIAPSACWKVFITNISQQNLTVSRNGLLIDDAATDLTLKQYEGIVVFTDGTNYYTDRGTGSAAALPAATTIKTVGFNIGNGLEEIATLGVIGSIQVPWAGTIVGWSIEETSGNAGTVSIDVCKAAGTRTLPVVPNTTTDKISASAPIALTAATTNGTDASGLVGWTTSVAQWDSILFNLVSASTVERLTGYILIQT